MMYSSTSAFARCKLMSFDGMASSSLNSFISPHHALHDEEQQQALILPAPCSSGNSNLQDLRGDCVEIGATLSGAAMSPVSGKRSVSFSGIGETANREEDFSEGGGVVQKRRLNAEQVRTLEKNFEQGNKLEPERKMQLAVALGLQPRQVSIWFQNRRARWKTKKLEKDYDALKRQVEAMKSENEALQAHNIELQAEIMALKGRVGSELINLNKETEGSSSDNSSEINLAMESPSLHPHRILPYVESVRPLEMEMQCLKDEHGGGAECSSFSYLLCSMEDHSAPFWPWPDHLNFH